MLPRFFVLGALAAGTSQASDFSTSGYSVVHSLGGVPPEGWAEHDAAGAVDKSSSWIKLHILLSQPRMLEFYDLATRIATPGDALYGQHLSKKEADAFLAPKPKSLSLVQDWLKSENLGHRAEVNDAGDGIVVEATVEEAERLLKAQYNPFVHQQSGHTVLRTLQYSVPDILADHIDVVQPTTYFGMLPEKLGEADKTPSLGLSNSSALCYNTTPACLTKTYNYGSAEAYSNGRMGIAGFLNESFSSSDLAFFMEKIATQNNTDQDITCVSVNGGKCPDKVGTPEASLDTQYAGVIVQKIPLVFYSAAGHPPVVGNVTDNEPWLDLLSYMLALGDEDLPNTMSFSYGDVESSVPEHYAAKCCDMFAKLGARGVSLLISSGDTGVGGKCADGRFEPTFPASCPWVTSVGGTRGTGPEKAWTNSGGGFSNYFARPGYQADTVDAWLKNDQTHAKQVPYFNVSGRAYPDVAALATYYPIVAKGDVTYVSGTSASAPVFASIVQLVNSDRLSRGQRPLGFLNPWLYKSAGSALTDITRGVTKGCKSIHDKGFDAIPGWDPTTGFGTPDFEKLLQVSRAT